MIPDAAVTGILEMRESGCHCCGPWLVESGSQVAEFGSKDDARKFYATQRIRRLAAIHGITDERRINAGISALTDPTP